MKDGQRLLGTRWSDAAWGSIPGRAVGGRALHADALWQRGLDRILRYAAVAGPVSALREGKQSSVSSKDNGGYPGARPVALVIQVKTVMPTAATGVPVAAAAATAATVTAAAGGPASTPSPMTARDAGRSHMFECASQLSSIS